MAGVALLHHRHSHSQEDHDHHGCTTLHQLHFTRCLESLCPPLWRLKAQELKELEELKSGEPPTSDRSMSVWLSVLFESVFCGSLLAKTVPCDSETGSESVEFCFGASCSAAGERRGRVKSFMGAEDVGGLCCVYM